LGEFRELEKQSIYFSPPEQLNDPMEGYRKICWKGDNITWRNFLRHYVISIHTHASCHSVAGDTISWDEEGIPVFQHLDNFPTEAARRLCEQSLDAVTKLETFIGLLAVLSGDDRRISQAELSMLLELVHVEWLLAILQVFYKEGLLRSVPELEHDPSAVAERLRNHSSSVREILYEGWGDEIETINEMQAHIRNQLYLLSAHEKGEQLKPNIANLFFEFPQRYLSELIKLIFPPWHVACFSQTFSNSAMWSHYAGNHSGCCLVFKPKIRQGQSFLSLTGPIGCGTNGVIRSESDYLLERVSYANDVQEIEFFNKIGRFSADHLMDHWFQSPDGAISPLASHLEDENQDEWRRMHWNAFNSPLLRKLKDWEREAETRIVLTDMLSLHDLPEDRVFTYDYNVLDGIIFGLKVSIQDKLKIMRIVDEKLSGANRHYPFRFFQAHYDSRSAQIEAVPMNLLGN